MPLSRRPGRRFSTLDLVILLASTMAGLAWLWPVVGNWAYYSHDFEGDWFLRFYYGALPTAVVIADPFLSAWTLAWCLLRFRGPRPRWRRLVRQPGVAVGLVAVLAWLAGGIVTLRWGADVHHGTPNWIVLGYVQLASATMLGGFGVLVTWAGSALDGRWRPELSWVDRMGRALGVGWVGLCVPSGIFLEVLTAPFY